jgi:ribonuclease P protein component
VEEKNCQLNTKARSDHRLKLNSQFAYIFKNGERYHSKNFILFSTKSKYSSYKIGYSISKKEGKANKRNLLKRRLREIVRTEKLACDFCNYILKAKEGACELDYQEIKSQVIGLFEKAKKNGSDKKDS